MSDTNCHELCLWENSSRVNLFDNLYCKDFTQSKFLGFSRSIFYLTIIKYLHRICDDETDKHHNEESMQTGVMALEKDTENKGTLSAA